jgi:general secretion pathway protein K
MRTDRGFALVLVLWAMILLTVIGISFGFAVRIETGAGTLLADQVRAEAAATAGIRRAVLGLLATERELRWHTDGRQYEIPWPDATLRVSMRAENGKIDLNYAPRQLLAGLFENLLPGADADALADAVIDWRDRDDRRSAQGAEDFEYRAAGRWGPANSRFTSVAELSQVLGFDAAMVSTLTPHLTVFARRPRIDPVAANATVLAAIPGISPTLAEQFVVERDAALAADTEPDLRLLAPGSRYLDTRGTGSVASIRSEARLEGGASAVIEAVINLRARGQAYEVLDWRQPLPDQPPDAAAEPTA